MLHSIFAVFFILFGFSLAIQDDNCAPEEFLKTFTCIGGLAEFVATVDTFNMTVAEDRKKFSDSCKVASECFNGVACLHADRLQLFLETFCSYSTFLETDFKKCKDILDNKKKSQCEKNFKSFFDNTKTEDVKCGQLEDSLKCVKDEVTKECGEKDAENIEKYLVQMAKGLSCDEVKKMAEEKKKKLETA